MPNKSNAKPESAPKKTRKKKTEPNAAAGRRSYQVMTALIVLGVSFFCLVFQLFGAHTGILGEGINKLTAGLFGNCRIIVSLLGMIIGVLLLFKQLPVKRLIGFLMLLFVFPIFMELITQSMKWATVTFNMDFIKSAYAASAGGVVGSVVYFILYRLIGTAGVIVLGLLLFVISVILIMAFTMEDVINYAQKTFNLQVRKAKENREKRREERAERLKEEEASLEAIEPVRPMSNADIEALLEAVDEPITIVTGKPAKKAEEIPAEPVAEAELPEPPAEEKPQEKEGESAAFVPLTSDEPDKPYLFPPTDLLEEPDGGSVVNEARIRAKSRQLERTIESFGVKARVTAVYQGPTVTRYELQPDEGIRVNRIVGLNNDIALRLAAKAVRIEAPIPGKSAIGIEVPNDDSEKVFIRELMESEEFKTRNKGIPLVLGKDIAGAPVIGDLAKMPHLLIAGATGSGKSVGLNSIIAGLLYKFKPEDLKMILIDPKMVEFAALNGIPHLVSPVVNDAKQALSALNWAVVEMTNRYKLFSDNSVKDIRSYNEHLPEDGKKLPYIVIIIDELADLMMVAPSEVENAIIRLAQLARAAGIHLIIATQRPSAKIITGLIKSNVPSRISFAVSSQLDSRIILDEGGAEKLIGNGDMLFHPLGSEKPSRVQGAFISEEEMEAIVGYIKEKNVNPEAEDKKITFAEYMKENEQKGGGEEERDLLFRDAGIFIIEGGQASTSMLQRRLKLGYARAARIMDQLTDAGVIAEQEGNKPREVLMTLSEFEEIC